MSPKKIVKGYSEADENENQSTQELINQTIEEQTEQAVANPDIPCGSGEDPLVAQITASMDDMTLEEMNKELKHCEKAKKELEEQMKDKKEAINNLKDKIKEKEAPMKEELKKLRAK